VSAVSREREILQVAARYRNYPGVLTLTTQHLTFTRRSSRISKARRTTLFLPLESIGEVKAPTGSAAHTLVVRVHPPPEAGPDEFTLGVESPARVRDIILDQVGRQRARSAPRKGSSNVAPSVSVVIQAPVVSGSPRIMVRCPYCHTVYPELDARCPACGAPF
jgi:hypothetical protein